MNRLMITALAWSVAALGAQAAPADGPQAIYDRAQAAYDRSDWAGAAAGFAELLPKDDQPLKRSGAVIASRYGEALLYLGRLTEAADWEARAIPTLAADPDPEFAAHAYLVAGSIARRQYDYPAAMTAFEAADRLAASQGLSDATFQAATGLAFAGATVDPQRVRDRLARVAADPKFKTVLSKAAQAQVEDLQARAAMNMGDAKGAEVLVRRAVDDSGGLTVHVSVDQVAIRGDAGIIAHLRHDDFGVQQYFTYTGAGHLNDLKWVGDHAGELPICGDGPTDVKPDDFAVVTFAIGDDGAVINALPVYASRPGFVGETFAKAVSQWRWEPAALTKVSPFWRETLQLELRCARRPETFSLLSLSRREAMDWLKARQLVTPAELAFAENGGWFDVRRDDPRLSQPGGSVLAAVAAPAPATSAQMQALWARLDGDKAPPVAYAIAVLRSSTRESRAQGSLRASARVAAAALARDLPALQARFPGQPAIDRLVLLEAFDLETAGDFAGAEPYLKALIALPDSRLAHDDPLRAIAMLHEAIVLDHTGQPQAARDSLEHSGLSSSQCSLFDTHPLVKNASAGLFEFPADAQRWRFEGFVQVDFGIADDGAAQGVRAVVAYPPFVFEDATTKGVSRYRFEPPRLGGKVVGCEGESTTISYKQP